MSDSGVGTAGVHSVRIRADDGQERVHEQMARVHRQDEDGYLRASGSAVATAGRCGYEQTRNGYRDGGPECPIRRGAGPSQLDSVTRPRVLTVETSTRSGPIDTQQECVQNESADGGLRMT